MIDSICVFEGIYYSRLLPLVYLRPQYDLRCGILTLREKILSYFPSKQITLHCRSYLSELVKQQNPNHLVNEIKGENTLFINGRVIVDKHFVDQIQLVGNDTLYMKGDQIVAAKVTGSKLEELKRSLYDLYTVSDFSDLFRKEIDVKIINYPWDLITYNGEEIRKDFELLTASKKNSMIRGQVFEGAHLLNKENIFIDEGARIKPGVVLDAESGPIYIGKNALLFPSAILQGPVFIGQETHVKMGATIYDNTSIGEVCKVGGEIEDCIIHSHSNKQHGGFLGHSYLGSWVNIGADSNNSDLKNNYGSVKVIINDQQIDSGSQFVGLTMGDHSKCAINTMFNTGTVVGVASNIFGSGFPPKYVPSFAWGGPDSLTTYDPERSLEVARRVMTRRNIEFTELDEKLLMKVFDLTREERRKRGMPN